MTNIKKVLLAATALTMISGAAMAQTATGGNKVYTDQQGQDNELTTYQDQASGSEIGTPTNPILQNGEDNYLVIDQDGTNQKVGAAGGDFEQSGFNNEADILQQGSGNNTLNLYQQSDTSSLNPPRNELFIDQLGTNNLISSIRQLNENTSNDVDGNVVTITQEASANTNIVSSVEQTGGLNDLTIAQGGGYRNVVDTVKQTYLGGGDGNTANITQRGNYNGDVASIGAMSIDGWTNDAGDGNDITQTGNNNSLTASFTGDANRFGFLQFGGQGNSITATVNGSWNEVGIKQIDSENTANVTINGGFNELGITQDGEAGVDFGNVVTAVINSSGNAAVVNQNGGGNIANINQ